MDESLSSQTGLNPVHSFFDQTDVEVTQIPVGPGVPLGIQRVANLDCGLGGVFGTWGEGYDNAHLPRLIEDRLGEPLATEESMDLSDLGFDYRHHIAELTDEQHLEVEIEVGAHFLREAARASGWNPSGVDAVLIGTSGPVSDDFTERIAERAGIPDSALKVSIHKACDGSIAGLHLALNPSVPQNLQMEHNLGYELQGKKVLVGGIEGLSRFMVQSRDKNALQLFGNGAGVIGLIPGQSMKFLVGHTRELYDEEGLLQVRMCYPHSGERAAGKSMIEISQPNVNHLRLAGLMNQPRDGSPVIMAGLMGMVKLFVRTGVSVATEVYQAYQERLADLGQFDKKLAVAIVHHANLKINKLIEKHLLREGIHVPMPWLLSDFGNVSAASTMIAFLRKLAEMRPADHILIDGFGAGTYYDVLAVELGG
jgi:3-oxoacyl-[acyl-carrier-protein] synthase III